MNPYMSLCNLNFAPIFGQQISILDPPLHWTFWSVLVWTFTLWVNLGEEWGGSIGSPTFFVMDGQKRDYLIVAHCCEEARLKKLNQWIQL